jgi:hypothetical protein
MPGDTTPDTVPAIDPAGAAVTAVDRGGQIPG